MIPTARIFRKFGRNIFFFSALLGLSILGIGQSSPISWQSYGSKSGEVRFLVPPGEIIVNDGGKFAIYASSDGATISVEKSTVGNAKDYVKNISFPTTSGSWTTLEIGKSLVRQLTYDTDETYAVHLYIASPKDYFRVSVDAKQPKLESLKKFLASIQLSGRYLVDDASRPVGNQPVLILERLQSSPIVDIHLNKEETEPPRVTLGKVERPTSLAPVEYSRRLIILRRPKVDITGLARQPGRTIRTRITLLKTGEIGEIIIETTLGMEYTLAVARAARGIKFIPAEVDGKPVDSVRVFEYFLG